jgi:nucleoid DNA-binding protein
MDIRYKTDIVDYVAKTTKYGHREVNYVITNALNYIANSLSDGYSVQILAFGAFCLESRKPRIGRKFNEPGKQVVIPAQYIIQFKPCAALKTRVIKNLGTPTQFKCFDKKLGYIKKIKAL